MPQNACTSRSVTPPSRRIVRCRSKLRRRGVDVRLYTLLASAARDTVLLVDGTELAAGTLVWAAGVRPSPVLKDLPGIEHARNGGLVTNEDMSVTGRPGVWALGDSAWIPTRPGADLNDKTAWIRAGAALDLGRVGPAAGSAVPLLIAALRDENHFVRAAAVRALGSIRPHDDAVLAALKLAQVQHFGGEIR